MLLLLLLLHNKGRLRDFYEIRQGVTVPASSVKGAYKAINLSGIDACSKRIDVNKLIDYDPVREVGADKLLCASDYLVAGKGEVKGFSMLESGELIPSMTKEGICKGIVASNHFLVLRPRDISGASIDEIRFAHNILDILLPKFKTMAALKTGGSKYLTINDLGEMKTTHPWSDSDVFNQFTEIMTRYNRAQVELNEVKAELDNFNRDLSARMEFEASLI